MSVSFQLSNNAITFLIYSISRSVLRIENMIVFFYNPYFYPFFNLFFFNLNLSNININLQKGKKFLILKRKEICFLLFKVLEIDFYKN